MEITMRQIARIRDVIKNGFADPDFGPYEVAAKAGISLRYLQKLFTQQRLDVAANSSIRFVWIALRIFCIAECYWAQASLSAKSATLLALATTLISLENFVIGSVTHQARTQTEVAAPPTNGSAR
jgi:hypothetical protein